MSTRVVDSPCVVHDHARPNGSSCAQPAEVCGSAGACAYKQDESVLSSHVTSIMLVSAARSHAIL